MEVTFIFSITGGEMFFTRCIVSRALIFVRSQMYNMRGPDSRQRRQPIFYFPLFRIFVRGRLVNPMQIHVSRYSIPVALGDSAISCNS